MEHRWSGWPGAWCLDCGAEDIRESCLASTCGKDHDWKPYTIEPTIPICENTPCPEPGSNRHDPYKT